MKINWNFANGEVSEVEVSEEIGAIILESRREESNRDKMEQRHCYSYDTVDFEGEEYGSEDYYACLDSSIEENARIHNAFDNLTKIQQRRLLMLAKGLSIREIARLENVHHRAIEDSISAARKKIQKNF
jgi:DNA-directed RNA polymerase specialized sigma24 family protein